MDKVKIKLVNDQCKVPAKQTEHASGYDAYVRNYTITPDGLVIYYLGFYTEIPPHMEGIIAARSSITNTQWVMPNGFGLIDSDYRGEWQFRLRFVPTNEDLRHHNLQVSKRHIPYDRGDRCCQVFFREKTNVEFSIVDGTNDDLDHPEGLSKTSRQGGFGSTKNN